MEYPPVKIGLKLHIPIHKSYYKNVTFSSSRFASPMLERRCRNLSRIFFGASFFDTLSNISSKTIYNSDIFAETTSVFILLLTRYKKCLATDQYAFFPTIFSSQHLSQQFFFSKAAVMANLIL